MHLVRHHNKSRSRLNFTSWRMWCDLKPLHTLLSLVIRSLAFGQNRLSRYRQEVNMTHPQLLVMCLVTWLDSLVLCVACGAVSWLTAWLLESVCVTEIKQRWPLHASCCEGWVSMSPHLSSNTWTEEIQEEKNISLHGHAVTSLLLLPFSVADHLCTPWLSTASVGLRLTR